MGSLATDEFLDPGGSASSDGREPESGHLLGDRPAAAPTFSQNELWVLEVLSRQHRLTFSQLLRQTGLEGEELRLTLSELHTNGLVVRLHTVIESYCCHIAGPGGPDAIRPGDCPAAAQDRARTRPAYLRTPGGAH